MSMKHFDWTEGALFLSPMFLIFSWLFHPRMKRARNARVIFKKTFALVCSRPAAELQLP